MSPWIIDVLGAVYVLAGLTTAGIIAPWGLRGVRAWLLANRPHSTIGWIFAPFWLLVMIGLCLFAFSFLMTTWPIVAIAVLQWRRRERASDRALDADEEEELFREVRRSRLGTAEKRP